MKNPLKTKWMCFIALIGVYMFLSAVSPVVSTAQDSGAKIVDDSKSPPRPEEPGATSEGIAPDQGKSSEGSSAKDSGAGPAGQPKVNPLFQFLPLVAMVVIFYFLLIRPQRTQQKKRQDMLNALKVGDKVLTTGGIYGVITKVSAASMRIKIAPNVEIRVARAGVTQKTTKDDDDEK